MIYKIWDGRLFAATSPEHLVVQMRNSSFTPSEHIMEYMAQFQHRVDVLKGKAVRSDTPEHFLEDLLYYGIVKVIPLN